MLHQVADGLVQGVAVVDARAEHDLGVGFDADLVESAQVFADVGGTGVAQQFTAEIDIGGVDGDVERAQALLRQAGPIVVGKVGEGDEVAVQEGEAVVVVLDVERAPHAFGQTLEEAEEALVVADAGAVESVVVEFDAQRLVDRLFEFDDAAFAVVDHVQFNEGVGGLEAVVDLVADGLTVDGDDLITGLEAGFIGQGTGINGADRPAGLGASGHGGLRLGLRASRRFRRCGRRRPRLRSQVSMRRR